MSYATKQDMVDRFGTDELVQLTDAAGAGDIDDERLARALADAAAEIDGYLHGRYALPLATVPSVLSRLACDLARYHLYADRATEQVTKRYDDAVKFLRSVGKGEVSLGVDSTGGQAKPHDAAEMQSGGNVFDRSDDSFI